jgi:hypothetical protein
MEFLKAENISGAEISAIGEEGNPISLIATALNIDYYAAEERYKQW